MKKECEIRFAVSPQLYETLRRTASYNNCSIAKLAKIAIFAYFTDYVPEASEKVHQKCITNAAQEKRNDEKERSKGKEVKKKENTHTTREKPSFVAPTIEECKEYAASNPLCRDMDVEAFFDHFTSNGWKVSGRAPMKDWKAALRNWARHDSYIRPRNSEEAKIEMREKQEKHERNAFLHRRSQAAKDRNQWRLCEERCVNWQDEPGHYCSKGAKWPPQWNDKPIPPQECRKFQPIAEGGDVS